MLTGNAKEDYSKQKSGKITFPHVIVLFTILSMYLFSIHCDPTKALQKPARRLRAQSSMSREQGLPAEILWIPRIKQDHVVIMATISMFRGRKANRTQIES
jgi:hypothetical protein